MFPDFLVAILFLSTVNLLTAQSVRAVGHYISDIRPAAGIGVGENVPKNNRPELASRIGIPAISDDTEDTISYVEDLLAGRVKSPSDLPKSIYDSGSDVIEETRELDAGVQPVTDDSTEYLSPKSTESRSQKPRQAAETRVTRGPHPPSPCPSVFSYEGTKAGKDRWYGVILVSTDETLTGVRLEIRLNKAANLLGAWLGEVSSVDNIRYTIWNGKRKIQPGPPLSVKFFIKYSEKDAEPPKIRTIRLNGRQICPGHGATTVPPSKPPATPATPKPVVTMKPTIPSRPPVTVRPDQSTGSSEIVDGVPCGIVEVQAEPLITHGQQTSRGQWPWHAALYQSKGTDLSYICGGSLIGKKIVVTAAHCVSRRYIDRPVDPETLVVYLGKYHLKLWSEGGVQDKQVREIHVHPEYNSTDFRADIAIIVLSASVEFTLYVKPVCLWDRNRIQLSDVEGVEGVVVGWGYDERGTITEELMMAKMPVVSQQTCIWSYPQFFSHFTSDKTYCAGFRNGTSVCNGDSGGGMVFPKTSRPGAPEIWSLRGIVSLSTSQDDKRVCNTKHYVVFTDVAKFRDWIQKYL